MDGDLGNLLYPLDEMFVLNFDMRENSRERVEEMISVTLSTVTFQKSLLPGYPEVSTPHRQ